jgi:hypothetical protein
MMLGFSAGALSVCWLTEVGWIVGAMRGLYVLHVFERGPCPEPPLLLPAGFGPDEIGPRVQEQALSSARIWVRVFSESIRVFVKYAYFRSQILEI